MPLVVPDMIVAKNRYGGWMLARKDDPEMGDLYFDLKAEAEAALSGYRLCMSRLGSSDW